MSTFITSLILGATEALWAVLGKLVTKAFLENLMSKLIIAALEKLAKSTNNTVDDSVVADVKKALTGE